MAKRDAPYVVVGAGLAGLACAKYLQDSGVNYLLVDENSYVGGRVHSVKENSYTYDSGFQVILNSYPEFKNFIDLKSLDMRYFNSGCLIYTPEKMQNLANPILHPSHLLNETLSTFVDMKDKSNVISLIFKSHFNFEKAPKTSTLHFLQEHGFSPHFIDMFWKPFFAGVMLDEDLTVDSRFFLFLLKSFSSGAVGLPAEGMQQLPNAIYKMLNPDCVVLNRKAVEITSSAVMFDDGEVLRASGVAVSRAPSDHKSDFFSVENLYFRTSEKLDWGKWLVIVPPRYGMSINNIALLSEVAPEYVQFKNETFISVSVLKSKFVSEEKVSEELKKIIGRPIKDLEFLKRISVRKALPKVFGTENGFINKKGISYFGDWATTPSINGAIESGRKMAQQILLDLN
jgi:hypothetical protein